MSLKQQIEQDRTEAMKARDADRLSTLRMLWSEIKNEEIGAQEELTDEDILTIIARQSRQLSEAIKEFEAGGREDLAEKNQAELKILKVYLPEQLSDEGLESVVMEVLKKIGASSPTDMGKAIGVVMADVKGKADGNRVKEMVMKVLQS
ncbi:MAG: GatB/YqeY domain-containing protein [Candidatus Magasanikbacteria bacterium]